MQIRLVEIQNFRGIKQLQWNVGGPIACLIGPGDSTKSTILDALELALSPRYVSFSDADFHNCDYEDPILVTVTVGQLPPKVVSITDGFGQYLRGWSKEATVNDEPQDQDELVLSVRLKVDKTLEPQWAVVSERFPDGVPINQSQRQSLGVVRIGTSIDTELGWGRGSRLGQEIHSMSTVPIFAEVSRQACRTFSENCIDELNISASSAADAARVFGVRPESNTYIPGLDPAAIASRSGAITLYDGCVPLRQAGLGTRRLVATAVQQSAAEGGTVVLIDEVEDGLEPYRLRYLLRMIDRLVGDSTFGQVIMTTHSPVAVVEMCCEKLRVVRKGNAGTTVLAVDSGLQGTVRKCPESLLSRKVIVCEGKTEYGLLRAMECGWSRDYDDLMLAHCGVSLQDGEGSRAAGYARHLRLLGYDVLLFADSDDDSNMASDSELTQSGIVVVRWTGKVSTEERMCLDLPDNCLLQMLDFVLEGRDEETVMDTIHSFLKCDRKSMTRDMTTWLTNGASWDAIRTAFGSAAKSKNAAWFKRIDFGESLGEMLSEAVGGIPDSDIATKLREVEQWAYGQ